ncbi:hypothetical protein L2E82_40322 [Cichorium intybus]|uniref:Uncharacterized protein n=1 Tax=Cichorium intybus TaxID=13427 RepID=A0ACB9AKH4_CICIN|nr:hypothetical protein L2E82_40322 [Cichorium intybus]
MPLPCACPLCHSSSENEYHLLVECSTIMEVCSFLVQRFKGFPSRTDSIAQITNNSSGTDQKIQNGVICCSCITSSPKLPIPIAYSFPATEKGSGDASSMITEESRQEVTKMDQLEAELESEF